MGLSKEAVTTNTSTEQLMTPEQSLPMGIDPEQMEQIMSLLTTLYPSPIKATVRELVSNAVDATTQLPLEQQKPVEVGVGHMDTNFTVTDHGVGMSPEDLNAVYRMYGTSTKRHDFTAIGAYGLGAKAPLSYCSAYTVRTTHEGVTTALKMMHTDQGHRIEVLYTEVTNHPSGTEVTVPFEAHDMSAFEEAARIYRDYSFDAPIVVNGEEAQQDRYIHVSTVTLDNDSGVTGRVWLDVTNQLSTVWGTTDQYSYWLAGWLYANPNNWRHHHSPTCIVELKPGVVNFTSSRDDITDNERSRALGRRIGDHMHSTQFAQDVINAIVCHDSAPLCTLYALFSRDMTSDGVLNVRDRHRNVQGSVTASDQTHAVAQQFFRMMSRHERVRDANLCFTITGNRRDNKLFYKYFRFNHSTGVHDFQMNSYAQNIIDGFLSLESSARDFLLTTTRDDTHVPVIVVSGVDGDNIGKVLRSRSKVHRSLTATVAHYILQTPGQQLSQDALDVLTESGSDVYYWTADEFVERAKQQTAAPQHQRATARGITVESQAVPGTFLPRKSRGTLLPSDCNTVDAVVVVDDSNLNPGRHVVLGLENAGIDTTHRYVYVVKQLPYKFFAELTNQQDVYFNSTLRNPIKSQRMAALYQQRHYHAAYCDSLFDCVTTRERGEMLLVQKVTHRRTVLMLLNKGHYTRAEASERVRRHSSDEDHMMLNAPDDVFFRRIGDQHIVSDEFVNMVLYVRDHPQTLAALESLTQGDDRVMIDEYIELVWNRAKAYSQVTC